MEQVEADVGGRTLNQPIGEGQIVSHFGIGTQWEEKRMNTGIVVRKATADDVHKLKGILAAAFQDDPAMSWAAPSPKRRERHLPRYFELLLRRTYLPKGEVYMTEGASAVAVWAPPEKWQEPFTASLPFLPVMLRSCGGNLPTAFRMLNLVEAKHKEHKEPHYYLPFIATDPNKQGMGYGTALLRDMLDRCDAQGIPAYLEATSMGNQALYHRHGFSVVEDLSWPGGGPLFWPMWREPR